MVAWEEIFIEGKGVGYRRVETSESGVIGGGLRNEALIVGVLHAIEASEEFLGNRPRPSPFRYLQLISGFV